jgi:squalene-associated FAD-dependent desaturase
VRGRVVVVGGGLAGIAAALDCADAGASVALIESRGRLGGAVYSFARNGLVVDNGQHVFLRCCTAYRALVERLDAHDMVALQPRLSITVLAPGGRRAWLGRSGLPAPLHLARALARYRYLSLAERVGVARAMRALRAVDPEDPGADACSFGDWLTRHGQGPAAVETIWSLIARPTLNLRTSDASLAQAAYVFQTGLLRDAAASDIGYAAVPLSVIHDQAAQTALTRAGVDVCLRRSVTAITPTRAGFRVAINAAPALTADAVVLAVPPDRAARLAPPAAGIRSTELAALGRSPIVDLHVVYDRRVLEHEFAAAVHSPVQWLFDRSASAGIERGQYLAVSLSAADQETNMSSTDLRTVYLSALAELLPAACDAQVETFFVTREYAATFRAAPGARAFRPPPRTKIPGLVLGGSWTDTGWPATMEGAVRSGQAAAREALTALRARPDVPEAVPA